MKKGFKQQKMEPMKKKRENGSIRTSETPARLRQYPLNLAERREKSLITFSRRNVVECCEPLIWLLS